MSTEKHTHGPWHVFSVYAQHEVRTPTDTLVAVANSRADARLMAAAPGMVNALRSLLRHAERVNEVMAQECGVRFVDDGPLGMARDALREAGAA